MPESDVNPPPVTPALLGPALQALTAAHHAAEKDRQYGTVTIEVHYEAGTLTHWIEHRRQTHKPARKKLTADS
jgi:hypothetical protein